MDYVQRSDPFATLNAVDPSTYVATYPSQLYRRWRAKTFCTVASIVIERFCQDGEGTGIWDRPFVWTHICRISTTLSVRPRLPKWENNVVAHWRRWWPEQGWPLSNFCQHENSFTLCLLNTNGLRIILHSTFDIYVEANNMSHGMQTLANVFLWMCTDLLMDVASLGFTVIQLSSTISPNNYLQINIFLNWPWRTTPQCRTCKRWKRR